MHLQHRKTLLAALLCAAGLATLPLLSQERGRLSAQKPAKDSKELRLYKKLAEQGRVDIQYRLGELYDPDKKLASSGSRGGQQKQKKGQPFTFAVTKSYTEALRWYEMAAAAGNGSAQSTLGDMYYDGKVGGHDEKRGEAVLHFMNAEKAAFWFTKSVVEESTPAEWRPRDMARLAFLYSNGLGVVRNDQKAFDLMVKSAEGGFNGAQYTMGLIWEDGRFGKQINLLTAAKWYFTASHNGHKDAGQRLSYLRGRLTPQEEEEFVQSERDWDRNIADQQQKQQADEQEGQQRRQRVAQLLQNQRQAADAAESENSADDDPGEIGVISILKQSQQQQAAIQGRINAEIQRRQEQAATQRAEQQATAREAQRVNAEAARQETARLQGYQQEAARLEQEARNKQDAKKLDLTKSIWSPPEVSFDPRHSFPVTFSLLAPGGGLVLTILTMSISIGQVTIENTLAKGTLTVDILNTSNCTLLLGGFLYSDYETRHAIKDLGTAEIGPGQRSVANDGGFTADANSRLVFKPSGFLHDCQ